MRTFFTFILGGCVSLGVGAEAERADSGRGTRAEARRTGHQVATVDMQRLSMLRAEEVRAATDIIADEMDTIRTSGGKDSLSMGILTKSIRGMDKMDPANAAVLQNVSLLFDEVLETLENDTNVKQATLDAFNDSLAACAASLPSEDAFYSANVNESAENHTLCRQAEEVLFIWDAGNCSVFINYLNGLVQPQCTPPNATTSHITEWTSFLTNGETWFNDTLVGYIPRRDNCINTTLELDAQILLCDQLQQTYEDWYCQWRAIHNMHCFTIQQCDFNQRQLYATQVNLFRPLVEPRVLLAQLILHVQCLVDNLAQGIVDKSLCPFVNISSLIRFNNTFPDLPMAPFCNNNIFPFPGHSTWMDHAYSHLSVNTPPREPAYYDCA